MAKSVHLVCAAVSALALSLSAQEAKAPLRMITEATFPPYEFLRGDKIVGIDVAICEAIAKELGRPLVIEDAKFDAVISSVQAGKADIAAAGITVTEDRKKNVDFSVPYVTSGIVIISKVGSNFTSVESVKGHKIGVQSGTTSDTFCVDTLKQEPDRFDSPAAAAAAMKAGKVELVIADIDPAKNIVKGDDTIRISSDFLSKEEFAVAIKKGQPELLATINKTITSLIKSGELDKIIERYTKEADSMKEASEDADEE